MTVEYLMADLVTTNQEVWGSNSYGCAIVLYLFIFDMLQKYISHQLHVKTLPIEHIISCSLGGVGKTKLLFY